MSRISIDVTAEEHQKLKAMAALQGKTIKEFVLERTLGEIKDDEEAAMQELLAVLNQRVERARRDGPSNRTVGDIFEEVYREHDRGPPNG